MNGERGRERGKGVGDIAWHKRNESYSENSQRHIGIKRKSERNYLWFGNEDCGKSNPSLILKKKWFEDAKCVG